MLWLFLAEMNVTIHQEHRGRCGWNACGGIGILVRKGLARRTVRFVERVEGRDGVVFGLRAVVVGVVMVVAVDCLGSLVVPFCL